MGRCRFGLRCFFKGSGIRDQGAEIRRQATGIRGQGSGIWGVVFEVKQRGTTRRGKNEREMCTFGREKSFLMRNDEEQRVAD